MFLAGLYYVDDINEEMGTRCVGVDTVDFPNWMPLVDDVSGFASVGARARQWV